MSETRKLAAIMFTDIAGYTGLMGVDEQKALRVLAQSRALVQQLLPQFHGTLIEDLGDGALCSFQSALEAVHCARAIQGSLRDDPDLRLRIGIHVGDVLFSADEVIGDGVNVASRIHALAEPGGICVSEQVYDAIRNQPDIQVTPLGERRLKNVNRAIKVYALSVGYPPAPGATVTPPAAPQPAELPLLLDRERRQLTLVCCRLTMRSLDGTAIDLEDFDQLLHIQHARCAELAARNDGQTASVLGDRMLLVFGYPQAREDDARRATRTALQIAAEAERASRRLQAERHVQLDVRVGVHTGLVVVREWRPAGGQALGGIVGATPEVAARLVERAGAGEVLVSVDTHRLLRGEIPAEPAGDLEVSELPGRLRAFRLIREPSETVRLDTKPPTHETPLVGRARQLSELLEAWERTRAGQAGAIFIRGEPGLGKSRLVRELRRQVPANAWLECHCLVEDQDTPLRPLVDLLGAVQEPIESLLTAYGFDLGETLPLLAALLSRPIDGRYRPLVLSPERQKELTLNVLLSLLLRMAEQRPLVFVLEDLHWADPTTLELAGLLLQEVRAAQTLGMQPAQRFCFVYTARPEFEPPWSTDRVAVIQLAPLGRQEVEAMITAGLARGQSLPTALVDAIVERADGIPLFVEEVTRVLIESGARFENGDRRTAEVPLQIPSSLRDLLTARLDSLSHGGKETAQLAALLGREFRYQVLQAVSRKDEWALREDLAGLTAAGLVFPRRGVRGESYVFKHALVRDTAYESMVRTTRRGLHLQVANVLRQQFPDVEADRPEILAQHFEQGGELATAVDYWHRAGDRALKRAAYIEATQQLERGRALLGALPESPARDRQEIELLTTLGTVLFSTRGHAAGEVEQTFSRARQLCERLGEDLSLKVLAGIASVYIARSDLEATTALLPRFERLAARTDDVVASITGHAVLGGAAFWSGDFVAARHHLAVAKRFYGTEAWKRFSRDYGYDGGFFIYPYTMSILWNLGYPDQAEALRKESMAIAEASGNPYSILIALGFAATLTYDLGQPDTTLTIAERLGALSTEQHLYFWSAIGMLARGGALSQQGNSEDAIALITQGLDVCRGVGVFSSYGYYLTYLAAAHARAENVAEGLAVVEEGLSRCQTELTRFHESELHRLKGDLLVLQGEPAAAEASYRRALVVAQHRQAKSPELRAAIGMGRLLQQVGRSDEARAQLAGIYGWFTEGAATKDLRDASRLLAELG
jgi:class 3 adenylate cyclase/tetratricopeptide (TPR) repeat protein